MHRPPRAAPSIAVLVGVMAVLLAPAATLARAPHSAPPPSGIASSADAAELARHDPDAIKNGTTDQKCTGWNNTFVPPLTIRVLRTKGPDAGFVETVPFRQYVLTVMPPEWGSANEPAIEQIGALAVKQYGWYYTIVYRGGKAQPPDDPNAPPVCYDVTDDTTDQWYQPESNPNITSAVITAVNMTWRMSLRKYHRTSGTSSMMLAGYQYCNPGGGSCDPEAKPKCGSDANGGRLFQRTLYKCVNHDGLDFEQTLRMYLDPKLEIVTPGAHNVIGTRQGDGSVLAPSSGGTLRPRMFVVAQGSITPMNDPGSSVAVAGWLGSASADMNRDGFDDLVTLSSPGGSNVVVKLALSDHSGGYQHATSWWSGNIGVPAGNAQLLVSDFSADLRPDVAMLVNVPVESGPAKAELLVLPQYGNGSAPPHPTLWWTGPMALTENVRVLAGDVNGDGAADLLVLRPLTNPDHTVGIQVVVAPSAQPGGGFAHSSIWFNLPDVAPNAVVTAMGDFNRDGKDDLALAYRASDGSTHVDVVHRGRKVVERIPLLRAASGVPIDRLKLGSADTNMDGVSDLVFYLGKGAQGTSVMVYRGGYTSLTRVAALSDPSLVWASARPY